MEEEKEIQNGYPVWVDWEHRVVSFQKVEGFEELQHRTHDEMFLFAIRLVDTGFAIQ